MQVEHPSPTPEPPVDSLHDSATIHAGEQFLRFRLPSDTVALLPVQQLAEIVKISYRSVIPIPDMPAWVSGVYNWRGEILWILDLGHLLGLTPWQQMPSISDTHSLAILRSPERPGSAPLTVGAIVQSVEGIKSYNEDGILSPPDSAVTPELAPFLRGFWLDPAGGDILTVLEGTAIFERLPRLSQQGSE
ncbi:MAG: chemotaxis protein CheW [Synechococcus sp.]